MERRVRAGAGVELYLELNDKDRKTDGGGQTATLCYSTTALESSCTSTTLPLESSQFSSLSDKDEKMDGGG